MRKIKTPEYIAYLSALFLISGYFIIIWILFGEFDLLGYHFLLFKGKQGYFGDKEIQELTQTIFSPFILVFLLPYLLIPLIFMLLLRLLSKKWICYDTLPINLTVAICWIIVILTGLIPYAWSPLIILLRVFIVTIAFVICFFSSSKIVNIFIRNGDSSINIYQEDAGKYLENKKMLHDIWSTKSKKRIRDESTTYVELPPLDIKNREKNKKGFDKK